MNVKIIAEIGINHKGNFDTAKKLIDIASNSGAWAVKFQYRGAKNFYQKKDEIGDEILESEFKRSYLSMNQLIKLSEYAHKNKLKTGISFFNTNEFYKNKDMIKSFDFLKIPSSEFMNEGLLKMFLKTSKQIIISTGGNNKKQILYRIKKINIKCIILHCISNYPTLTGFQNLKFIEYLCKKTNFEVGYSSHDKDWEINLIAMSLGAKYIERHLTLNKNSDGLDDSSSSDELEFRKLCYFANNLNLIVGTNKRPVNQGEIINMQNLGSSLFARNNLKSGTKVNIKNFTIRAPRTGISTEDLKKIKNKRIKKDLFKDEPLTQDHFNINKVKLNNKDIEFCNKFSLSLPLRLHDFKNYYSNFRIKNYELHLSFNEVNKFEKNIKKLSKNIIKKNNIYSIHLPDYISRNRLFNPLSENKSTKEESNTILQKVLKIATLISEITEHKVNIVGSFSRLIDNNKIKTLESVFDLIENLHSSSYNIYPQWLPKIAWFYGGAEIQSIFCDNDDIDYIIKKNRMICLDIAHLILSSNYNNSSWMNNYKKLKKNIGHFHLSDAKGLTEEGIELGKGELKNISEFLNLKCTKVIETWQGHLSSGKGFYKTIKLLKKYK
tara:strand:+ start:4156 stop:5976 length:1821 start_codon:yes stop_codon:yes gene_type:complete